MAEFGPDATGDKIRLKTISLASLEESTKSSSQKVLELKPEDCSHDIYTLIVVCDTRSKNPRASPEAYYDYDVTV